MSLALTDPTSPVTTAAPRVTAPPGTGFVVIPGGTPGQTQSPKQPAIPGSQNDAADFYGLAAALAVIVLAIFVVRKVVPLRRQTYVGRHPTQPPAEENDREDARP
ncbi:MAG: hypothetical protein J2P58_08530 [Acidimicrobiaceae bacterium]|nr:hypothetical protein [Acidimicrobiaceae bacterium]